jgi:hypothetical protein
MSTNIVSKGTAPDDFCLQINALRIKKMMNILSGKISVIHMVFAF